MTKRNTVLALVAAGSLTVVAFAPALAVGLDCSPPNLDRCPIYGVWGNPTPHASSYQSSYQMAPRPIRHSQSLHTHYSNPHG